jgi:hypothetical protein
MWPQLFDRSALNIKPLADRKHDLDISVICEVGAKGFSNIDKNICEVAERVVQAKQGKVAIVLMIGAHVIRSGVQRYLIDLMERGYISCIATNGGAMIHDFEFALIGATTESVARYIKEGQFGLWKETAELNNIIAQAYREDRTVGMGQAVGRYLEDSVVPYKSISILAAGYRLHIPVTIHVGIGYDTIHEHPNCDGAATGALSYNDFLRFASVVQNLKNGVVMNFGSAVMAPEVFLKALSMARSAAHQCGKTINHFTVLVCDLVKLPDHFREEPSRADPRYYFRPWKTMLVRTIAGEGESFYVRGMHSHTIPGLWYAINAVEAEVGSCC